MVVTSLLWAVTLVAYINADVDALIDSLLSRQATLSRGTVRYTHFQFLASDEYCSELNSLIKNADKPIEEIDAVIVRAGGSGQIVPLKQHTGVIFYDGERWHLSRALVSDFSSPTRQAREKAAKEQNARLLPEVVSEEVAYNGEYLTVLEDREKLIKRPLEPGNQFTRLRDIDVTFLPWNEMRHAKVQPGESNSVAVLNSGTKELKQEFKDGAKGSWTFSVIDGYAPLHVALTTAPNTVTQEKLYRIAEMGAALPVVQAAVDRRRERDGRYRVDCWLISEWSPEVAEADLTISTPTGDYVTIDERFGKAAPQVGQYGSGLDRQKSLFWTVFFWVNVLVVTMLVVVVLLRRRKARIQ